MGIRKTEPDRIKIEALGLDREACESTGGKYAEIKGEPICVRKRRETKGGILMEEVDVEVKERDGY